MIFDSRNKFPSLFLFMLGLMLIGVLLTSPGCASPDSKLKMRYWAGDSKSDAIVRSQENKKMQCSDASFDNMTCVSYEDVKKLYKVLLECK